MALGRPCSYSRGLEALEGLFDDDAATTLPSDATLLTLLDELSLPLLCLVAVTTDNPNDTSGACAAAAAASSEAEVDEICSGSVSISFEDAMVTAVGGRMPTPQCSVIKCFSSRAEGIHTRVQT